MKMLGGERVLRLRLKKLCGIANVDPKLLLRDLTAFRRAVIEDCAKVVEGYNDNDEFETITKLIAAAIRARRGRMTSPKEQWIRYADAMPERRGK